MKTRLGIVFVCMILIVLAGCNATQSNDKFQYAPGKGPADLKASTTLATVSTTPQSASAQTAEPTTALASSTTQPSIDKANLPKKGFNEGDLVSFPNLAAKDADGDPITYKFTAPLDDKGQWQTKIGDAGEYIITITASDGKSEASQSVLIMLNSVNKAPIIEPIADITINEGETVTINAKATDPDGDKVTLTYSGWMTSDSKATTYDDAGNYAVTITASDGKLESKKDVKVTVKNVNRQPIIKAVEDKVVIEGDLVSIATTAADPDEDKLAMAYPSPFDASGAWQTKEGDASDKTYTIAVSDGDLSDSTKVAVKVVAKNKPPVLTIKNKDIVIEETDTVVIDASATDPDGDNVTLTYSGWMTSSTRQTDYGDEGKYTVTVTAWDGKNKVSETVNIEIKDKNRPPQIII